MLPFFEPALYFDFLGAALFLLLITIAFFLLLFLTSCKGQTSEVLIGLQMIESDPIRGDFVSDNDIILSFDRDSMEVIPLWQGCIIAPAIQKKYPLLAS